jgi:hypothetical protein
LCKGFSLAVALARIDAVGVDAIESIALNPVINQTPSAHGEDLHYERRGRESRRQGVRLIGRRPSPC